MKFYEQSLQERGFRVVYVEAASELSDVRKLIPHLIESGVTEIHFCTAQKVSDKIRKMGVSELEVLVKGPGSGRESAIRALGNSGIEIKSIEDQTPLPHNGCRPRKRRRV